MSDTQKMDSPEQKVDKNTGEEKMQYSHAWWLEQIQKVPSKESVEWAIRYLDKINSRSRQSY